MKALVHCSRGHAIIFLTVFLFLMVLFIGLATDVGWMAYVRSQGQAAVDAAALSAAAGIPSYNSKKDPNIAYERMASLNNENVVMNKPANLNSTDLEFCANNESNCAPAPDTWPADRVRITKGFPTPLFFGRVLNGGISSTTINVSAVALYKGTCSGTPQLPLTLMGCEVGFPGSCDAPKTLDGFNQSPSPYDDSAFTSYFTPNASADVFKGMANGSIAIPEVKCGDAIELNNGQVSSAIHEIETEFNKKQQSGKWTVLLPVIDCADLSSGNPVQKAKVIGFATVCITGVDASGTPKAIKGSLDCSAKVSGTPGGTSTLFGTYATAPILVK
jgi:Flp pilus assembly protein TadG